MATRPSDPQKPIEYGGGTPPSLLDTAKLLALVTFLVAALMAAPRVLIRIWPELAEPVDTCTAAQEG